MGMYMLIGLTALVVLYGVFRKLDKSEGPQWLFHMVTFILTPFTVVVVVASMLLTVALMFIGMISGTIWDYTKSRFA